MKTVKEQLQAIVKDAEARASYLDGIIAIQRNGDDHQYERGMVIGLLRVMRQVERVLESDEFARLLQADENGAYYSQRVQ